MCKEVAESLLSVNQLDISHLISYYFSLDTNIILRKRGNYKIWQLLKVAHPAIRPV